MTSNNVVYYEIYRISNGDLVDKYHYHIFCKNTEFQSFLESFTPPEDFKIIVAKPDDDEEIHIIKTLNLEKFINERANDKIKLDKALKRSKEKYQEWMLTGCSLSFCEWIRR